MCNNLQTNLRDIDNITAVYHFIIFLVGETGARSNRKSCNSGPNCNSCDPMLFTRCYYHALVVYICHAMPEFAVIAE